MSVSIFSYRGEVTVGLMAGGALIPDPDHVVAQLEFELETLAHLRPGRSARRPAVAGGAPGNVPPVMPARMTGRLCPRILA